MFYLCWLLTIVKAVLNHGFLTLCEPVAAGGRDWCWGWLTRNFNLYDTLW
jgi:hypothetical protein